MKVNPIAFKMGGKCYKVEDQYKKKCRIQYYQKSVDAAKTELKKRTASRQTRS